jgi:hypothetical protein
MLPDLPKNEAPTPTCVCGQPMTHREWTEPALEGGTCTVYGVSCFTDGCQGNFPQRWEKYDRECMIERAAIIEYCGNVPRKEAERLAKDQHGKT